MWEKEITVELQGEIYAYFRSLGRKLNIRPYIEQRVQVGSSRFRIPDLSCTVRGLLSRSLQSPR